MAINKFQRSRLTRFDLSDKVPSIYQNTVISETTWLIELKYHKKTPYDKLAKIYTRIFDHMNKMAAT